MLLIRVLQGLALGGEYGGAAVYVAEHVPDNRRGYYTSFIQITATLGLFLSLAVILAVQNTMSADQFAGKGETGIAGWRIPFLISIFLVAISLIYSSADERVADFPARQKRGNDFGESARRSLY
ncbi:MAG: MFS transporter [Pyrinomonadaceae bacterium]